ncbi:class IV adenylate cyclase [Candidatus Pacearchaeota archaeon CG10_big_fil_rev_8_21_14_0_10_34_76]|nr:MAG: class IV adenylate cyclase [Candidatus Pacearchaeota archaeon CG10_big_fil_rev_8_21_14_0_10_34_76]
MEIEIKATFDDKEKLKERLKEIGAKEEKQKHQIDEYYNHPERDTRKTNEYIRLRYKPDENKGTFAYHINISDGVNKEFEVNVDNLEVFKQILQGLGFPLLGVIDKKRETYKFEEFTITLDDVKDIDNFLEIEVDGEESEIDEKKRQCMEMLKKLGLSEDNLCKGVWLCDIATGRTEWKK